MNFEDDPRYKPLVDALRRSGQIVGNTFQAEDAEFKQNMRKARDFREDH